MSIGVSEEKFWKMNPATLEPYYKAQELIERRSDAHMWRMGAYVFEAVSIALANSFRKKGQRVHTYIDKPYMEEIREERGDFTEDEKKKQIDFLFNSLNLMKANFDLNKKYGEAVD